MSVKVMGRVWAQSSRKDGELLVMLALADFSNDLGECWPGLDTLAQKARLTKSQVCRVLKNLEEIGEIRRARSRGGKSGRTHYFILSQDNSVIMRQSQDNSVLDATCTVAPMRQCNTTHTRNRHRTVNKERVKGKPSPDPFSPTVEKTIRRLNELSGKHYRPNSKNITKNLRAQLKEGFTETDFLLVVDDRWQRWKNKPDMLQHFNPDTLFRPSKFELYLTEAKDANGRGGEQTGGGFVG